MPVCILTDRSALFPASHFDEKGLVHTFPLPPAPAEFQRLLAELETGCEAVLVLTSSAKILPGMETLCQAAKTHGSVKISVLDTQQIGPGVGLLAQVGARASLNGATLPEVEGRIRSAIPHIYTLICPEFDHFGAPEDQGQTSIFSIEEGALSIYKKVRTRRHLLEAFQEFIVEFERPQHIAYFHARKANLRARPLRETVGALFPGAPFTEMETSPAMKSLFGPLTMGLTMMELPQ